MKKILYLLIVTLCVSIESCAKSLEKVHLSQYGSLEPNHIETTLSNAIEDIDGKCLVLPNIPLDVNDVWIIGKNNFSIKGQLNNPITCKNFRIKDCTNFELSNIYIKGLKKKFATFYVLGNCCNFCIHDCLFDSEKAADGHNQFYGVQVVADTQNPNASYENSPRHFQIYKNIIKNTRYDGILAHAYCSDFVIEKNTIIGAECIGIESEGRYGGLTNTTVHPCKNAVIRNNIMRDCGDWNVLLMWTDNVQVYGNRCYNGYGSFLSIGCTNLIVKNNIFEGTHKGFELSNEFFKISNGINDNVLIKGNTICGKARAAGSGVLDIRHSQNVAVKGNKVSSIYRDKTAMVSIASSKQVTIEKNKFENRGVVLANTVLFNNVPDYETKVEVPALDLENISVTNNTFTGQPEILESNKIVLSKAKCIIKGNRYK